MLKEAIFSPCRDCEYRKYDKSHSHVLLDAGGNVVCFISSDNRGRMSHGLKKFSQGTRRIKNPCPCQNVADYDDLIIHAIL
jgi:hypothetical protein